MLIQDDILLHYTVNGRPASITPAGGGATTSGYAIFMEPGDAILGGEVVTTSPALRYPVSAYPLVTRGARVDVAGRAWRVRERPRLLSAGDEAVAELELLP